MMYQRVASGSPHSSNGGEGSIQNTPDTTITAFSPEDIRPTRFSHASSCNGVLVDSASNDPFITPSVGSKLKLKNTTLSAKASEFAPASFNGHQNSTTHVASASTAPTKSSTTSLGVFTTETGASRNIKIKSIYNDDVETAVDASLQIITLRYKIRGEARKEVVGEDVYLRYTDIRDATKIYVDIKQQNPNLAIEYIAPSVFQNVASPSSTGYSAHEGQVLLTALYPIDASFDRNAFEGSLRKLLAPNNDLCAWQKILATEAGTFRLIAEFYDSEAAITRVRNLDGKMVPVGSAYVLGVEIPQHVVVSVKLHEPDLIAAKAARGLSPYKRTPTSGAGDLELDKTFNKLALAGPLAEYSSAPSPSTLSYMGANALFGPSMNTIPVMSSPFASALGMGIGMGMGNYQSMYSPAMSVQSHMIGNGLNGLQFPFGHGYEQAVSEPMYGNYAGSSVSNFSPGFGSGYGPSYASRYGSGPGSPARPSGLRQNAVQIPRNRSRIPNSASSHHNHVDIERIKKGIDVRTTVMLRNIPNKLDQAQLKEIVDGSSFGRYDFMYLRIDFSNNCNVGYAFINFTDPLDIIAFVEARSNKKWYRSDKVAEVSYATIQGKDCLVQKFRNSSVMLEPAHYRPKLFKTIHDLFGTVGDEEQFPESDNASKLKRSCENAEHVGLFAPSAGQHMRDEQRRRKSQYDRGTSLAEREEFGGYGYEEPYHYGYPPY